MPLAAYENLGSFYLGRAVDPVSAADRPDPLLYDSRDLTTHAVCVGMTGSGKTGLCLALLEEAAIDGIPAIAIDPKGDIGNLLLTFPELRPNDFAPWVDPGEAARKGTTIDASAAATAENWRKGLAAWDQGPERIKRFKEAVDVTIYTPGSTAGRSLSILQSFAAPSAAQREDATATRERVGSTVTALLGLVGIDADPVKSREHILLSTLLGNAWDEGRNLDLAGLIQGVQKPPFEQVGVFDLETFYPSKERLQLAMALNNLVAAPGFAAWMQGDPLDIQSLLYTPAGKPRIAVISIAHLNDAERMFVVTLLLSEMVAWMRRQSGTSSLRALLYMDEIFGYFPPTAMPPSKTPLLTLMKQARAFGVGVVLATQNPVDLDYKGLSNAGTWFIGRLQTERDKARVIEGLLGAGAGLERGQLESLLSNLTARVFFMRNAHDDAPVLFRTRWALSYLRGPLTLQEIARLQPRTPVAPRATMVKGGIVPPPPVRQPAPLATKPVIPAGIAEFYLPAANAGRYAPRLLGEVRLHFVDKNTGLDAWESRCYLASLDENARPDWTAAAVGDLKSRLSTAGSDAIPFEPTPASLLRAANYKTWRQKLEAYAYESVLLDVFRCPSIDLTANPGETEAAFRTRMALGLREKRDAALQSLRQKYAARLATLQDQIRRAQDRIERERSQLSQQKMQTVISVGTSILGALLGRKAMSVGNINRAGTAVRSAGRIGRESQDVTRATDSLEVLQERHAEMDSAFAQETRLLQEEFDPATATIQRVQVKPRKADIEASELSLVWMQV